MAFKTYAELDAAADVQGTDLTATWRSAGPMKAATFLQVVTYLEGSLAGTFLTADPDDARTALGFGVGDLIYTARAAPAGYLAADGSTYLSATYPVLAPLLVYVPNYTMTNQSSPFSATSTSMRGAFGAGLFVALDNLNEVGSSPDGSTWTLGTSPWTGSVQARGIIFGGGQFVASATLLPAGSACLLATSPDGLTWTARTAPGGLAAPVNRFAYGNGVYVGVGINQTLITSPDGVTWTKQASPSWLGGGSFTAVAFGNGVFVGVAGGSLVGISLDGVTWLQVPGTPPTASDIFFGGGIFIQVGASGSIFTSSDGVTWKTINSGTAVQLWSATYGNGLYVIVGVSGVMLTSWDAQNWAIRSTGFGSDSAFSVVFGDRQFAVFGESGRISTGIKPASPAQFIVPALPSIDYLNPFLKAG